MQSLDSWSAATASCTQDYEAERSVGRWVNIIGTEAFAVYRSRCRRTAVLASPHVQWTSTCLSAAARSWPPLFWRHWWVKRKASSLEKFLHPTRSNLLEKNRPVKQKPKIVVVIIVTSSSSSISSSSSKSADSHTCRKFDSGGPCWDV